MRQLRNTSTITLTLEDNGTHIIKWWVDPHDDMKSYTEGVMTLGKGAFYA